MKQDRWEIIILKPTATFLSFLRDKITNLDLPDLNILHADPTAYALRKQINDDETLNEIEHQFPRMRPPQKARSQRPTREERTGPWHHSCWLQV